MLPEFDRPSIPDTPAFRGELEERLRDQTERSRRGLDAPATPDFERALGGQLLAASIRRARVEPIPVMAVAAAIMLVVMTAGLLALLPSPPGPTTAATPGTTATTVTTLDLVEGSAEAMVVASFQRWVDGRTEAERLQTRYTQAGYDVTIDRRPVTNASLNGQVLGVRHVAASTPTTIGGAVRGTVIVVVGQAYHVGANISS